MELSVFQMLEFDKSAVYSSVNIKKKIVTVDFLLLFIAHSRFCFSGLNFIPPNSENDGKRYLIYKFDGESIMAQVEFSGIYGV